MEHEGETSVLIDCSLHPTFFLDLTSITTESAFYFAAV